jgi:poly(3-hydroxybutyrate) depolymerase
LDMKVHHLFSALLCLMLLAGFHGSQAQYLVPGPQVLTFFSSADDTDQPYGIYIPKNYDPAKKYPLVMMLHGAGSNHRLALRRVFGKSNAAEETDVEATRNFPATRVYLSRMFTMYWPMSKNVLTWMKTVLT